MRVPWSWLSELVDLAGITPAELARVLSAGGLEVESIAYPFAGTSGVRVAEVQALEPVEGSDRLSLVQAFDGEDVHAIVCGASNFAVGDRVPAALPGATLPGGVAIGAKALMGVTSQGMLASAKELRVGDDHSGIWLLGADAPLGADVRDWLGLDDAVLDLDVNPDRGYALSLWGVARDVAALTGAGLTLPSVPAAPAGTTGVDVTLEAREACRRFTGVAVEGVTVLPSSPQVQCRLIAAGVRARSNVIDATNLAMLETGHPVHGYDRELLRGGIVVRHATAGETLTTLDDVERSLDPDDLLITDDRGAIGLAGVMGGASTEMGPTTTAVYVESAAWTPQAVLRTARRHQLFSEASSRFEKTVPPQTALDGAVWAAQRVAELAGGTLAGSFDSDPDVGPPAPIVLRPRRAAYTLALDLDAGQQSALLARIGCTSEPGDGATGTVTVHPPAYRPDLQIEEDLYEEIARLHGYDRVPETLPSTGQPGRRSPSGEATRTVRRALAGGGWTEVQTFPFVAHRDLARLALSDGDPRSRPVALVNPLSQTEEVLRTTLLPGLFRVVGHNAARQVGDATIFEVGHVFLPPTQQEPGADGGPEQVVLPAEPVMLGLAAYGPFERGRHDRETRHADVFDLLGAADLVRRAVGLPPLAVRAVEEAPYHPGRAARLALGGTDVGTVGELHPRVTEAFQLPRRTLAGELRLDALVANGVLTPTAHAPSPLPGVRFDVAVIVDETVAAQAVEEAVREGAGERLTELALFDVFRGPQLGEDRKSLAYRLRLDDPSRQLTDADARTAIEAVAATVSRRLGGTLRR